MGEISFGFIIGAFLTGVTMTLVFLGWKDFGREECEKANNVYACEYVGQWQPTPPKQD